MSDGGMPGARRANRKKKTWAEKRFGPSLLAEVDSRFNALINAPRRAKTTARNPKVTS